ncbi:MAG: hypothetical protein LQ346_000259 [Caloplaca aetnensis]|nr:MAG: hypothetical protein LQ346_000259 [Caloplaca aetnensis]
MTSTIKIAVAGGDVSPGQINLRFSSVYGKKEAVVTVPLPNAFIAEEIRWYLEDFAQHHPSERERAKDAETALIDHGKNLAFYIYCSKVLESSQPTDKRHTLLVEVEDSPEMPPSMLWEALERKDALDAFAQVDFAVVTRVFTSGPLGHGLRDIAIIDCNGEPNPLTVLIVSARADFEKDIPHRLVAQEALKSLDAVSHSLPKAKELTRVEVIHPATFNALQSHLEGQKPGYFSLVHLDLHGVEDDSGR